MVQGGAHAQHNTDDADMGDADMGETHMAEIDMDVHMADAHAPDHMGDQMGPHESSSESLLQQLAPGPIFGPPTAPDLTGAVPAVQLTQRQGLAGHQPFHPPQVWSSCNTTMCMTIKQKPAYTPPPQQPIRLSQQHKLTAFAKKIHPPKSTFHQYTTYQKSPAHMRTCNMLLHGSNISSLYIPSWNLNLMMIMMMR